MNAYIIVFHTVIDRRTTLPAWVYTVARLENDGVYVLCGKHWVQKKNADIELEYFNGKYCYEKLNQAIVNNPNCQIHTD